MNNDKNNNKGRLIVIDGLDGSGKSTQVEAVYQALKKENKKVIIISYPVYDNDSSALVRMYLNGEFSDDPNDINAYAASSFYAVDRYAGYMQHWKKYYDNGYTIIAARYVSSNAIHQMVKLPEEQWDNYLNWLNDYEYNKLRLPKPDTVIFLNMSAEVCDKLINSRYDGDEALKDIHEKNAEYLSGCRKTAEYASKKENWEVVKCCDGVNPLSINNITQSILNIINKN